MLEDLHPTYAWTALRAAVKGDAIDLYVVGPVRIHADRDGWREAYLVEADETGNIGVQRWEDSQ
jgi:hypothetical protein